MTTIKLNKILLDEIKDAEIKKTMKSIIDIKNCLLIYYFSIAFKLSNLIKVSMSLMERSFPMFADCDDFLELDFLSIRKILLSSGLNIDTELQVFNAADRWLCHDITERSKYAKELLSKVRLPLLSIPTLKQILERVSSNYHQCRIIVEAVLNEQQSSTSCKITSRYCNQSNFNIVVFGGRTSDSKKVLSDVNLFYANNFNKVNELPNMQEAGYCIRAVCIKGEIYVFGGIDGRKIEKYSPNTNNWQYVVDMVDDRKYFSFCSFMDSVFIIGGRIGGFKNGYDLATCFEFNTKSLNWNRISGMGNERKHSACSVFEGRIVVSGGNNNFVRLNTVEAYDHVGDTWENLPNMINERDGHKSVAVKNKLFVFGGSIRNDCEVFDSTTKNFTLLKEAAPASKYKLIGRTEVITIGSKILLFRNNGKVITYDSENNEWSKTMCKATKHIRSFSILKYY